MWFGDLEPNAYAQARNLAKLNWIKKSRVSLLFQAALKKAWTT